MGLEFQGRDVLEVHTGQVGVNAAQDGDMTHREHRASLPFDLHDDRADALDDVEVGLAPNARETIPELVLLPGAVFMGILPLDISSCQAVQVSSSHLVQQRGGITAEHHA